MHSCYMAPNVRSGADQKSSDNYILSEKKSKCHKILIFYFFFTIDLHFQAKKDACIILTFSGKKWVCGIFFTKVTRMLKYVTHLPIQSLCQLKIEVFNMTKSWGGLFQIYQY